MLLNLINFRLFGYNEYTLAVMFGCDRKALAYQFKKYNIPVPKQIFTLERIIAQVISKPDPNWKTVNGEQINLGKNYKDYQKPH